MVRKKLGDVFEDVLTFSDTLEHQPYPHSQPMRWLSIYTKTQNCNVGRQGSQNYLLYATDYHVRNYSLPLEFVDLADLWFKAAASGAVVHLIGTYIVE
ncbi:hypothetical protein D4Q85_00075 [bacterium]|nr:MAG: hypothetical protein D4Q85_00075 [bacterium]